MPPPHRAARQEPALPRPASSPWRIATRGVPGLPPRGPEIRGVGACHDPSMARARLSAPLVLVAAALLVVGCGSGGHAAAGHTSTSARSRTTARSHPAPVPPASTVPSHAPKAADARTVAVIRHWADALRSGDVRGAARLFQIPSVFAPGPTRRSRSTASPRPRPRPLAPVRGQAHLGHQGRRAAGAGPVPAHRPPRSRRQHLQPRCRRDRPHQLRDPIRSHPGVPSLSDQPRRQPAAPRPGVGRRRARWSRTPTSWCNGKRRSWGRWSGSVTRTRTVPSWHPRRPSPSPVVFSSPPLSSRWSWGSSRSPTATETAPARSHGRRSPARPSASRSPPRPTAGRSRPGSSDCRSRITVQAPGYFGTPADPDGVFVQLVRNLTPRQSPVLRFGGDTADWTWAPTPGVAKPLGIRYTLGPEWMRSTAAAASAGRTPHPRRELQVRQPGDRGRGVRGVPSGRGPALRGRP